MVSDGFSRTIPLSETTKFIVDNRGKTAPTTESGIALIATNCITNDNLYPQYINVRRVSQETYDSWFRSHPESGDIILTNKGSMNGAICLVPNPVDFVIAQDMVALRADEEVIDPLFLFAALRSQMAQRQIKNLDVSGVIPHFKKTDFDKLHLPYPCKDTQKAIGRIYFDFCNKIELNRRMNETLEAMARAIFKSWFVDFDPVHAKHNGHQPPNMDTKTAKLFPDSFEHTELGLVPTGWKISQLGDTAHINDWSIRKGEVNGEIQYVDISSVSVGRCDPPARMDISEAPSRARRRVRHGDTIWSCVRPNRKSFYFIHSPADNLLVSTGFAVLSADILTPNYLYLLTTTQDFTDYLTQNADGSAYPAVRADHFALADVIVPDQAILSAFERIVAPMRDRIAFAERESKILAETRDTLLPKLLSGEIRVCEAEKVVQQILKRREK